MTSRGEGFGRQKGTRDLPRRSTWSTSSEGQDRGRRAAETSACGADRDRRAHGEDRDGDLRYDSRRDPIRTGTGQGRPVTAIAYTTGMDPQRSIPFLFFTAWRRVYPRWPCRREVLERFGATVRVPFPRRAAAAPSTRETGRSRHGAEFLLPSPARVHLTLPVVPAMVKRLPALSDEPAPGARARVASECTAVPVLVDVSLTDPKSISREGHLPRSSTCRGLG